MAAGFAAARSADMQVGAYSRVRRHAEVRASFTLQTIQEPIPQSASLLITKLFASQEVHISLQKCDQLRRIRQGCSHSACHSVARQRHRLRWSDQRSSSATLCARGSTAQARYPTVSSLGQDGHQVCLSCTFFHLWVGRWLTLCLGSVDFKVYH